jgi:hypothetical protein
VGTYLKAYLRSRVHKWSCPMESNLKLDALELGVDLPDLVARMRPSTTP